MFEPATLADLTAFRVAHASDADAGTGCTVAVAPEGAVCGVDVRGGGPATRETDLLRPENMVQKVHAVVLSGGSAFGLASATGVMDELAERKIGFELLGMHVPIVVGACIFDLLVGKPRAAFADLGAQATRDALSAEGAIAFSLAEGNVGAGCGASVGKMLLPEQAMKSGFGMYGLRAGDLVACALVAVNALGQVRDSNGTWIAGARDKTNRVMDPIEVFAARKAMIAAAGSNGNSEETPCTNTTIGVVLTNADLTKAQATKVSAIVHDAYARAIKPVHTTNDGDTIFTMASGEVAADTDAVAILATEAMQHAIERAVTQAESAYGLKGARETRL